MNSIDGQTHDPGVPLQCRRAIILRVVSLNSFPSVRLGGTEAVNIGPPDGRSLEAIFFADHAALEDADAFTVLIPLRLPSLARGSLDTRGRR